MMKTKTYLGLFGDTTFLSSGEGVIRSQENLNGQVKVKSMWRVIFYIIYKRCENIFVH